MSPEGGALGLLAPEAARSGLRQKGRGSGLAPFPDALAARLVAILGYFFKICIEWDLPI